jgi:hypothetical protein
MVNKRRRPVHTRLPVRLLCKNDFFSECGEKENFFFAFSELLNSCLLY